MSLEDIDCNVLSPSKLDQSESARKRMRLEASARKSWSLTDKRTDQEVLEEMGVSLLEPEDTELQQNLNTPSLIKSGSKRKRDIENVNPNVNSATKHSPRKSPRKSCSPIAGPSHACDTAKLESETLLEPYDKAWLDEETPEQFSGQIARGPTASPGFVARSCTPASRERAAPHTPQQKETPTTPSSVLPVATDDVFATLSDEVMLGIFKWLPKRTLAHCMLVCKRWHRVASDETFWQRLDLGNRSIAKDALGLILARKPIIVRFASSEIGDWHPPIPPQASRLQYLDLSMCACGPNTLKRLLGAAPNLKKLSLEAVPVGGLLEAIGKCSKLETLNLTMAPGVTDDGLAAILQGCPNLQSLNISWCGLCPSSLKVLCSSAPQRMQRLNVAGARIMTDDMVKKLVDRCPRLVELDLSDCSRLGAPAVLAVTHLNRLEHLALSRCYLLPPHVLTKLNSMPALQYLEVWGILQDASLAALKSALPAIQINQFMHSAIARPTVGTRRTSIWGLRTRD